MHMKKIYLRTLISTLLGSLLGIFCILGVRMRMPPSPLPSASIYLLGAWYNRLIMGLVIGFAGEFHFLNEKYRIIEAVLRGVLLGALISVSFSFLQQAVTLTYFFAGIGYGLIIDLVTTFAIVKLTEKKTLT